MTNSRNKGASAERELFGMISRALDIKVERNLVQTREGGADTSVGAWAIEVKRQEQYAFDAWWAQAVEQAERANKRPMLAYRKSRQPWRFRVFARDYLDIHGCQHESWQVPEDVVIDIDHMEAIRLIGITL